MQELNEVPMLMNTKFPATVMVLGIFSNEEDAISPPPRA